MDKIQAHAYEVLVEFDRICTKYSIKYILAFGTLLGAVRHQGFIPWDDDIDVAMTRAEYLKFKSHAHELEQKFFLQSYESDDNYFLLMPKIRNVDLDLQEYAFAQTKMKQGPWIDIFIYDPLPENQDEAQEFVHELSQAQAKLYRSTYVYPRPVDTGMKKAVKSVLHKNNMQKLSKPKYRQKLRGMLSAIEDLISSIKQEKSSKLAPLCFYETADNYLRDALYLEEFEDTKRAQFETQTFLIPNNYDSVLTRFYGDYMTPPSPAEQKSLHIYKDDYDK